MRKKLSTKEQTQSSPSIFIPIEGNIGSGKTTFTKILRAHLPYDFQLVPEPVDLWQKVGDTNLLELMYKDPERWGYTFQSFAFFSRLKIWEESRASSRTPVVFFERSVFSDK